MDWILENLKVVVFVIIIVVYVLKAMRDRGAGEDADPGTRGDSSSGSDPAETERTRQIQEEIRRRILARQRGEAPQAAPPPVVVMTPNEIEEEMPEGGWGRQGPPLPPPLPVPVTSYQARDDAAILEAQRALEEQFQLVRKARELARAGIPSLPDPNARFGSIARATAGQRSLRSDLAHPTSLRRAILLREVLGEPVGLRSGPLPRR